MPKTSSPKNSPTTPAKATANGTRTNHKNKDVFKSQSAARWNKAAFKSPSKAALFKFLGAKKIECVETEDKLSLIAKYNDWAIENMTDHEFDGKRNPSIGAAFGITFEEEDESA